jgi:hypothetical protein
MPKGFKGFDKDLKCREFQFATNSEFEHDGDVKCCNRGFHFCEHPLDVLSYYPPNSSRYCEVEGEGKIDRDGDDSKVAVSKIKIGAEIGIKGLIDAAIKFAFERVDWSKAENQSIDVQGAASATGDYGAASATGYHGAASATGDYGAASATGYQGAASATGDYGAASATGYHGAASATGYHGAASATGYQGAASATGYHGAASATGDYGAASATGYHGAASATGKEGIACGLGIETKAKGALGCWIVLAEWFQDDNCDWHIKTVASSKVDGETIKPETWYTLIDGVFTETE